MKKNWAIKFYDDADTVIAVHVIENATHRVAEKYMMELVDIYWDMIEWVSLCEI